VRKNKPQMADRFFLIIVGDSEHNQRIKTRKAAEEKAAELSRRNPNTVYHVLQAVVAYKSVIGEPMRITP
jgi:hypothetical protein